MSQSTRSSPSSDWQTARELGELRSDVGHLQDDVSDLQEKREKDKAELDRVKTWLERSFFLALLLLSGLSGHAVAPAVGTWIGMLMRALGGLRTG